MDNNNNQQKTLFVDYQTLTMYKSIYPNFESDDKPLHLGQPNFTEPAT